MARFIYENPAGSIGLDGAGNIISLTQTEFEGCCCVPSSCLCDAAEWAALVVWPWIPCHGLVHCYRIKDYVDGSVLACATCANSGNAPWDGRVWARNLVPCYWWWSPGIHGNRSIDGKTLHVAAIVLAGGLWYLFIFCGIAERLWWGTKAIGSTPVGTYTRLVDTCVPPNPGSPSALYIEECP